MSMSDGQKKRVLVVEDTDVFREMIAKLLREVYDVTCAKDGRFALSLLLVEEFDLVITDLNMPRVDGELMLKTACSLMRRDFKVLLQSGDIGASENMLQQGLIDTVLPKPWRSEELMLAVKNLMKD